MRKVKIGIVGFFHHNARGDRQVYDRTVEGFLNLQKEYDFDFTHVDFPVYSNADGEKAVDRLNEAGVDFAFLFCPSVANGNAVIPFSQLKARVGLLSVEENAVTGYLPLNSFCGSMVTAGILGTYLKDFGIKYKWFFGYPDTEQFKQRFDVTYRALRAIVKLQESRIGVVGRIVEGFDHLSVNAAKVKHDLGITIDRGIEVDELVEMAKAIPGAEAEDTVRMLREKGKVCPGVTEEHLDKFARLYLALLHYAEENHYNALAISCWTRLQKAYDIAVCAPVAMLNEAGIVTACEADIDGAISMLIDSAMHEDEVVTMADLVNLDREEQSINLWHCGPAAPCLADQRGVHWDNHFDIGQNIDGEWHGCGVVSDIQYKPGNITISRLNSRTGNLLIFQGNMSEREGYQGSSGWVVDLRMDGEKLSLDDLLSTLFKNSIDHHLVFGYGHHEAAWREFAYWMQYDIVRKESYRDYAF